MSSKIKAVFKKTNYITDNFCKKIIISHIKKKKYIYIYIFLHVI